MAEEKKMSALSDEEVENVSGGLMNAGALMVCVANTLLYKNNPVGNQYRSASQVLDNVSSGTPVKLFEYGVKYCKVICGGQIGWIETALLSKQ